MRIIGSGVLKTITKTASRPSGLVASGQLSVKVLNHNSDVVTITADDNIVDHVMVESRGLSLVCGVERGVSFSTRNPISIEFGSRDLDEVATRDQSSVTIIGTRKREQLKIEAEGQSSVMVDKFSSDATFITASDQSRVGFCLIFPIRASTRFLSVVSRGQSSVDTRFLDADQVKVNLSDQSSARVSPGTLIDGSVADMASLETSRCQNTKHLTHSNMSSIHFT
jgi:hypothetical protein